MIKILIADDHTMFVDGIESILRNETDVELVAKCYDGNSVFNLLKENDIDVLLLDVNLPDISGIDVCKRLRKEYPKLRVLALSMYNEESFISEILKNGASGYILKNTGRAELMKAIQLVHEGQTYFSDAVTQTIMKSMVKGNDSSNKKKKEFPKISRREKEVLQLIIEEFTTQEIANQLFISLKTVESHRSNLLAKLNVRNTAGLVRLTIENNLLDTEKK